MRTSRIVSCLGLAAVLLVSRSASAQVAPPPEKPAAPKPTHWTLEAHAGRTWVGGGLSGTSNLPSTGAVNQGLQIGRAHV